MIEPLHTVAVKDELHTVEMLAELLHEPSHEQVLVWRRQRNWPAIKVGRRYLFTPEQVRQILAMQQVTAVQERSRLTAVPTATSRRGARRRT